MNNHLRALIERAKRVEEKQEQKLLDFLRTPSVHEITINNNRYYIPS